ncbi:MAG: polysaccharide deacetylase family protein [Actinobacteria bacterium]|nr:polysaccharide deacetylase family protein [Actinomycetota bacterium]
MKNSNFFLRYKKIKIAIISIISFAVVFTSIFAGIKFYIYEENLKQKQLLEEIGKKYNEKNFDDNKINYINLSGSNELIPGSQESFDIFYKNSGKVDVSNLKISLTLPKYFSIIEDSSKQLAYNLSGSIITFSAGTLAAGKDGHITLLLKLTSPIDNGTTISLPDLEFTYFKEDKTINKSGYFKEIVKSGKSYIVVSSPDFSNSYLSAEDTDTGNTAEAKYGDNINYKIFVENSGDMDARDIILTISNLDGLLIEKDKNNSFEINNNILNFKIPEIKAGQSNIYNFSARVKKDIGNGFIIKPLMEVSCGNKKITKEGQQVVIKLYPSFLKSFITFTGINGKEVYPGDTIGVTVNITNNGEIAANNVKVSLKMSGLLTPGNNQVSWNISKLDIGQAVTLNTSVKVNDNITKDSNASCHFIISSDEINSFESKNYNLLISGVKPFTGNFIPIIAIHGVDIDPHGSIELSTGYFDALCGTLKAHGYTTITFSDLLNYLYHGKALPEKPVIISSDDGYQNTYLYAFPILKKYHFKMTEFLVTGLIGNSDADRKMNEFDFNNNAVPKRSMLIWPEIVEMNKYGIEFLSHTVNHVRLGYVSREVALNELVQSKKDIESHLGKPVLLFAWPYGNFGGSSVIDLILQAGYVGGVAYDEGIEDVRTIDIMRIKRVAINEANNPATYAELLKLQ